MNKILADEDSPIIDLLGQMLDVPLFRLIAVVAATNIGSTIATLLFPIVILPWLAADIGGVGAIADLMIEGAQNSAELIWGGVA